MSGVVANANATAAGSDLGIHTSRQGNVVACAVATWAIAAVFVGLRFYLRGHLMKVLGREDWTMLLALAFSAGTSASFIVEAHYGLGKHVSALSVSMLRDLTETSWFTALWFAITIYLTKISILFLYMRTLTHAWVQKTLRVLMFMVVITFLTDFGLLVTACIPLTAYWDSSVQATYCHSADAYYAILGIQLGTDFLTFLLPLPVIWSMRAPKDQKLMLCMLFSFGFFICIVSIIRLTELTELRASKDWTYEGLAIDFWSLVEVNTGIVCACVMTMKPLLSRLVPGSTRKGAESTQKDPMAHANGGAHGADQHSGNPPTIGSKPSRAATVVVKKQSWFTVQLARLDETSATHGRAKVTTSSPGMLEAGWISQRSGSTAPSLPPLPRPPGAALFLDVPGRRNSYHSSTASAPIEHEADEGPLGPIPSYGRRPSGAGSGAGSGTYGGGASSFVGSIGGSFARRPSGAGSFGSFTFAAAAGRRPSAAGSIAASYARRPSCAG